MVIGIADSLKPIILVEDYEERELIEGFLDASENPNSTYTPLVSPRVFRRQHHLWDEPYWFYRDELQSYK